MFDKSLFKYDSENHLGYYKNKLIPSATQLVDVLYPLDDAIPEDRLKKAAEHGTSVHGLIEDINNIIREKGLYRTLKDDMFMFNNTNETEVVDYFALLNTYQLVPYDFEQLVFLLDENDEPICYGHFDLVVKATADITPFTKDSLYLADVKTTSLFDKKKVALQTAIYRVAYNQLGNGYCEPQTFGIWLKDGVKLVPLDPKEETELIALCKGLRGIFDGRR